MSHAASDTGVAELGIGERGAAVDAHLHPGDLALARTRRARAARPGPGSSTRSRLTNSGTPGGTKSERGSILDTGSPGSPFSS